MKNKILVIGGAGALASQNFCDLLLKTWIKRVKPKTDEDFITFVHHCEPFLGVNSEGLCEPAKAYAHLSTLLDNYSFLEKDANLLSISICSSLTFTKPDRIYTPLSLYLESNLAKEPAVVFSSRSLRDELARKSIDCLELVTEKEQQVLDTCIQNALQGIKTRASRQTLHELAYKYHDKKVILACTEFSLLNVQSPNCVDLVKQAAQECCNKFLN